MKVTTLPFIVPAYFQILQVAAFSGNNACKTFQDYFTLTTNKNCWYDPDSELTTPQLIQKYVGEVQEYRVTTEDGYVLTVHRLPRRAAKGVIYMQHSLSVDSRIYMGQGNVSLALVLWRAGYDVWLGNQRGTLHSEGHVNLTPADLEYWDFSLHEIGQYDVSAMIQLVRSKTGRGKVVYYGYSLGTTTGLIYATMRPEEVQNSVKAFILTSTAHRYVHFTKSIIAGIAPFAPVFRPIIEALNLGEFFPVISVLAFVTRVTFRAFPKILIISSGLLMAFAGWVPNEIDPGIFNTDFFLSLRNASWRLVIHYLQLIYEKTRFQMYDYGPERNRKIYGSDQPHLYPIGNITVPVYMISSRDDFLTSHEDDAVTYNTVLHPSAKIYGRLVIDGLSHFGQAWGTKARKMDFNNHILSFLERIRT